MGKQVSPFAALSKAEKQIRWLEYQSIKLPYIEAELDDDRNEKRSATDVPKEKTTVSKKEAERPQPPPEVPRIYPSEFHQTKHTQYDAVIARLKQAELQSRVHPLQSPQQQK